MCQNWDNGGTSFLIAKLYHLFRLVRVKGGVRICDNFPSITLIVIYIIKRHADEEDEEDVEEDENVLSLAWRRIRKVDKEHV